MLDDKNVIKQRDTSNSLAGVLNVPEQAYFEPKLHNQILMRDFKHVIIAGMGGSALAADMVKVLTAGWLHIPFEVVKGYSLPGFVNENSLVIAISHSGNTEETISCYHDARQKGAALAAVATGGNLLDVARQDGVAHVEVPGGAQPRMSTIYHLRALLKVLEQFRIIDGDLYQQVADAGEWLSQEVKKWAVEVSETENYAKQLAKLTIGKTPVFFAGELTWPLAYKWKISWNESAKNVAFWNQYPEFNHNEFIGWSSHPIEKPFAIVDLRSNLERSRIRERMELSDRLLSGKRPKAVAVELQGDTLMRQLLWGLTLGDSASIYTAILNGVDPAPVALVERLKKELS